ncbi:aBC transporter substrate-binding protein family 5 [Firmicutes bacterium CAG:94]|nr:aBC transporter substrate-binding protein family 5 [Firmicutes bacterium CAG:94]
MKTKKIASLLLAGLLALSVAACGQQPVTNNDQGSSSEVTSESQSSTSSDAEAGQTGEKPTEPTGQMVIGSITQLENEFYDTNYSSAETNYNLYDLLHGGAQAVVYTKEGEFQYNDTVVASHEETENEDGTKTFTVTIKDGLVWSDGTPITAKDYVFAVLLESSDEMAGVDQYPSNVGYSYVGYDEWFAGTADTFAGVHLVDDMTYSLTVKAEELPYHYDITYASVRPRPLHVIAPDCDVVDTENGAQITGEFTTELLSETINNTETGYRYNPQVTCGPYLFDSFDQASQQATLKVNPNYMGDYRGVKPVIETLIIKTVSSDTMMNELEAGTVDLLYSSSGGDTINAGLDLVEEGAANQVSYMRNGYGKIQFDCSVFPTDSEKVRQAIAYCLDRGEFARQYTGGYGSVVHSFYGLAQWEYQESADWINENLNTYDMNVEAAIALLEEDGWTLNADGTPYSGSGVRYKDVDGELKPLVIEWCNSEGNPVSELLATMLPETMEAAGMQLNATTTDFATLLSGLEHAGDTQYNMYNLATGFATANSPWYYFSSDPAWMGSYNTNWIDDQELSDAATALKSIPYEDHDGWLSAWQNFIKVWNEKLPDVPLYSDQYYDFISTRVQGWDNNATWGWQNAVLDAWVTE